MKNNLEEIARQAGVSRSTVSRVINNDPKVSPETRARVQEVIQRLNYHPNAVARSLAGGHSNILGVVIPRGVSRLFSDPYFPLLVQGITSACNARDYTIMLWIGESELERRPISKVLPNTLIDGVIIASMLIDDPLIDTLIEVNLPFLLVGRHPTNPQVSYIDVENTLSTREMVFHLLRLGYRRIGTVTGPANMIAGLDRLEGYRAALRSWGIPLDPALEVQGDFTEEGGYLGMKRLLEQKPEAVFVASDMMAIGALRAVREAGLRVPQEIALASFDDMPIAARSEPPLTTVRQPIQKAGATAAETLIRMINDPGIGPQHILLPTEIVIRESCGAALKQKRNP